MTDLVLYTHPMSRGRIARWMLEEVGVPYQTEIVDYGHKMKVGAYRAINPMGKVPAIRHGETIVTETAAICAYLADAFPQNKLAPDTGSPARGTYYRWMFFAAGPLEQSTTAKAMGWQVPEGRAGTVGFGQYADVMNTLEFALSGGGFLLGEHFSAADVYVGSHLMWGLQFGTIEKRPAFESYLARLLARPAQRRAVEIDNALMAEHPVPGTPKA